MKLIKIKYEIEAIVPIEQPGSNGGLEFGFSGVDNGSWKIWRGTGRSLPDTSTSTSIATSTTGPAVITTTIISQTSSVSRNVVNHHSLSPTTLLFASSIIPARCCFLPFICTHIPSIAFVLPIPMDPLQSRLTVSWITWMLVAFSCLVNPYVLALDNSFDDAEVQCNIDLSTFLPLPYGNLSHVACKHLWNSFILRYFQSSDHVVTIVISATYTTGWVGIGFSKDGMMLNASAMVGWTNLEGQAKIKQFHLRGFTPSQVIPDRGELPLTHVPPFVAIYGSSIYLAFQLKFANVLRNQPILLAFGSRYPVHHHLTLHDDKGTINFVFSSANSDAVSQGLVSGHAKATTHGILGLMSWGLVLPCGAMIARFLKHRDPLWYYLHLVIGFVGFILAIATVVVGVSVYQTLQANVPGHRGLGIFILVLSILQVLAFFLRPNEDSKWRQYWIWYHHWVGRIALFLGAVNLVLGIHIAGAGNDWKIGLGFLLGLILLSFIVLEVLLMLKRSRKTDIPENFQMNPYGS